MLKVKVRNTGLHTPNSHPTIHIPVGDACFDFFIHGATCAWDLAVQTPGLDGQYRGRDCRGNVSTTLQQGLVWPRRIYSMELLRLRKCLSYEKPIRICSCTQVNIQTFVYIRIRARQHQHAQPPPRIVMVYESMQMLNSQVWAPS